MGLFDSLFGSKGGGVAKHAAKAGNKRAQNIDRYDAIAALAEMETREAVEALLPRFTFRVDPSIVDQEEKDVAFEGCVAAGEAAVEPVTQFLLDGKEVSWSLKILERLVGEEDLVSTLLSLVGQFDTEYERDPTRKIQAVSYLEDRKDQRIAAAVLPFLEDMNDEVRFHAVRTLQAQDDVDEVRSALHQLVLSDESARVRARVAEVYVQQGWVVPVEDRQQFEAALPDPFSVDPKTGTVLSS